MDETPDNAHVLRYHSLCAKSCGREPVRGTTWCAECWAAYSRAYRKDSRKRIERKALMRGAELMRQRLVAAFRRTGQGELNGLAAAEIVRDFHLEL